MASCGGYLCIVPHPALARPTAASRQGRKARPSVPLALNTFDYPPTLHTGDYPSILGSSGLPTTSSRAPCGGASRRPRPHMHEHPTSHAWPRCRRASAQHAERQVPTSYDGADGLSARPGTHLHMETRTHVRSTCPTGVRPGTRQRLRSALLRPARSLRPAWLDPDSARQPCFFIRGKTSTSPAWPCIPRRWSTAGPGAPGTERTPAPENICFRHAEWPRTAARPGSHGCLLVRECI